MPPITGRKPMWRSFSRTFSRVCYAPSIVPVTDIQLLEGMAEYAGRALPSQDRDVMKMIAGWRWAATKHGEASPKFFLTRRGIPLPLRQHIVSNARKVIQLLDET